MTERHVAGHATHFLRRLDRVADGHVELALTLYRDAPLLKEVLGHAALPDAAERVAISLEDALEGPFIVVTRDGKFVTCLARGMRPKPDEPTVSRERLDVAIGRVERMRERVATARAAHAEGELGELSRRIHAAGTQLAREDFESVARFEPLMPKQITLAALETELGITNGYPYVARMRLDKLRPENEALLAAMWDAFWSWSHLFVLMHVGDARRRLDSLSETAADDGVAVDVWHTTTANAMRYGIFSTSARALWAVGRHARPLLPTLKKEMVVSSLVGRAMRDLPLAVVAHASAKSRAEATHALDAKPPPDEADPQFEATWEAGIRAPLRDALAAPAGEARTTFEGIVRAAVLPVLQACEGLPTRIATIDDVPLDVARALLATQTRSWASNDTLLLELADAIPWLARAEPGELFLPRAWADALRPVYDVHHGIELAESLRLVLGGGRPTPVRRETAPGRNDPCSCGSGKKFKKCCGKGRL